MTDPKDIPSLNSDQLKQKAEEILNDAPPEVKKAVKQSQSFYEENKKAIHTVLIGVVVLRVYKKKVAKQTAKAVLKALQKTDGPVIPYAGKALPTMFDVWNDLKATPGLAYIPHSGGMVHLLGPSKDVVVTVFGNFEKMDNDEIWSYVAKALLRG